MSDPEITEYDSVQEFLEHEREVTAERNTRLHPRQQQITWGSWFTRFYAVNPITILTIFCRVETVEGFRNLEIAAGADEEEMTHEVDALTAMHENGFMFGRHFSTIEPTGEWGHTHLYNCWPIDEPIYLAAEAAEWDVAAMDAAQRQRLQEVYDEFRAWVETEE